MYTGARGTCFAQGQRTRVAQSGPSFARQKEYKTFQMKLLVLVAGQPEPDPQKKKKSSSSIHISALYFLIVRPLLLISVSCSLNVTPYSLSVPSCFVKNKRTWFLSIE
jgi:hypothetical protein